MVKLAILFVVISTCCTLVLAMMLAVEMDTFSRLFGGFLVVVGLFQISNLWRELQRQADEKNKEAE